MPRKKKTDATAAPMFDVRLTTAPCVPAIRDKVDAWRAGGYEGASDTTHQLLNYWFHTDHRVFDGRKFAYHYSQQRAIETLIYLYEIAKVRRQKSLIESYSARQDLKLLQYDDFARYCVKMATGSGKTKVMVLAIAWQYFNAVAEGRDDFAKTFLIIAPNVIVFERLRSDFGGGRIFRLDPVVPDELRIYWDFQCYLRSEAERASSLGALYLTNVQQLHDRAEAEADEPDIMTSMLGTPPPARTLEVEDFFPRIARAAAPFSSSTTRPTTRTTKTANGTSVFAVCTPRRPAVWRRNWISPRRRDTPRGSCSRGPCTIIRSSRPSSIASSSGL